MTTDFRAELQDLYASIQLYTGLNPAAADVHPADLTRRLMDAMAASAAAFAQPEPVAPTDGEVTELVAWLRQFANAKKGYRRGTTAAALALKVTRAANLLELLASDNAGLAQQPVSQPYKLPELAPPTDEELDAWWEKCAALTREGKADCYWAFGDVTADYVYSIARAAIAADRARRAG
jgi:hypothetical protein